MAVTARFYVAQVTKRPASVDWASPTPFGSVTLHPATRGEENKAWASATPSGKIEMTLRSEALPWFEERLGKDLHITFDDVPAQTEGSVSQ